tara:strand:- start:288 stop:485 length:198 start_codon:yes stop_codon:yes gene_type:complete
MFNFIWRMLGYKLDKDIIKKHQLARALAYEEQQAIKEAQKVLKDCEPKSFSRVVIENARPTEIKV